jgi:NAD(P)-dependent dehydrogenase (short-subunit alcohol dehydrogenase family)
MDLGIEGHAALVAASTSGLGKAAAESLAAGGADVVVNGRDPDRLADAVADVSAAGSGEVVGHRADLTDPDAVAELVEAPQEAFGRLDHLVVNAGGPPALRFEQTDRADWQAAFDLLVQSAVDLLRAAADPLQADGGGSIVAVTARGTKEPLDSNVLSSACRMPVVGVVKTLSRELAPEVRANTILTGAHVTPRNEDLFQDAVDRGEFDSVEAVKAAFLDGIPFDRFGRAEEFGNLVAFLSSERARFLTGAAIPMDGGASRSAF